MILYGAPVREKIKADLIEKIKKLGIEPCLAIVQVGGREDSDIYIRQKQKFGDEIGVEVRLERFKDGKTERLIEEIKKLNRDENVNGIIVQLPLPEGLDSEKILKNILPEKDADGLTSPDFPSPDQGEGGRRAGGVIPATARAVMALLDFYKISVKDKKVAVIGRSKLAGGPIARIMKERGGEVTVCHRSTENMAQVCREADILISAAGKAGLVTKEFVKSGQVVVDVGINRTSPLASRSPLLVQEREGARGGVLVGDVNFDEVEPIVSAIT
ncbi:MAG: bifunctional 5,10-methylenetetrahydrofolate dehydrogenase/5,10-methenyltetrahydrofolate cyclohydrolase, partial [Candidatus Zambryskibacteria bacterium]